MSDEVSAEETLEEAPVEETVSEEPASEAEVAVDDMLAKELEKALTEEEPEEVTEVVTEEEPEEAQEETPQSQFVEYLKQQGIDKTYESDEEAYRGAVEAMRLVGQRNDDAVLGRQLREQYGDEAPRVLQFLEEERQRRIQESNKPKINWQLPEDPEQAQEYTTQRWAEFIKDPMKLVEEIIAPAMMPKLQGVLKQRSEEERVNNLLANEREFVQKYGARIDAEMGPVHAPTCTLEKAIELTKLKLAAEGVEIPGTKLVGEDAKKRDVSRGRTRSRAKSNAPKDEPKREDFENPEDYMRAVAEHLGLDL